jgi:LuxR family transcriptional regulator, maltose regulon positive regulatory protein
MSATTETLTFARTKIQAPRMRSDLLVRAALCERIANGLLNARLTLISAAGGFGKSSAIAQTLSANSKTLRSAWIGCETSDTLGRFASALVAALDPLDPPWRTSPDALIAGLENAETRLAFRDALINALAATDVSRAVIVFDDAHRLNDDRLHEFLSDLPSHLPDNWGLALVTREDPPWSLARLRATGDLVEIRQDDLRFESGEVEALAIQAGKSAVAEELMTRTEGWAVGIALALSSSGKTSLVRSERHAIEYLQSEVLAALPKSLRSFLVQTSVLPELTASRCAAVTGREDSDDCLDEIERRGLFFQEVEGHDRAIRLHDIFRDALAVERDRLPQDQRRSLWKRAAESESDATRRIEYLIASEDFGSAVAEYAHTAPRLMTAGQSSLARAMLARFPKSVSESSTDLAILRGLMAWESMNIRLMIDEMKTALANSEKSGNLGNNKSRQQLAKAYVSLALANYAPIGENRFDERCDVKLEDAIDPHTRAIVSLKHATRAFDTANFREANLHYSEALAQVPKADDPSLWLQLLPASGYLGLRELEPLISRYSSGALNVAGEDYPTLRAVALGLRGSMAMWRGELDHARATLDEAVSIAAWINHPMNVCFYTHVPHLWCRTLQGEIDVASQDLRRIAEHVTRSNRSQGMASWYFYWVELRAALIADREDIARRAIESIRTTLTVEEAERLKGPAIAISGIEAMLDARYGDARGYFAKVLAQYGSNDAHGMTTATRLLLAKIELASNPTKGTSQQAISLAKDALATIRARGYPLAARFAGASAIAAISQPEFTQHYDEDERETLIAVQRWLPATQSNATNVNEETTRAGGRASALVTRRDDDANDADNARITRLSGHATTSNPTHASDNANAQTHATRLAQEAAESISPREMEVLELIAAGESNKIIARRLDLSPHTVKRHVANILGKLGVDSRGQAAARYRELVG